MRNFRFLWSGLTVVLTLAAMLWMGGAAPAAAEDSFKMSPKAALEYRAATPELVVLDVRTPGEYAQGHLEGSVNIPVEELEGRLAEVPADRPLLIYCRRGARADRAYNIIKEKKPEAATVHFVLGNVEDLLK